MDGYLALLITVAVVVIIVLKERYREKKLLQKYGDMVIVKRILSRVVWIGESVEQLRESLGSPQTIKHEVTKTTNKQIWKYNRIGKNRYQTKITIENNEVVGFDM